jgi:uncharacterized protein YjgD (DUF1641 family)
MTDRTKWGIDFLDTQNKDRKYQEKKKAIDQLKELLKNYSSDTLIDMIMKESDNKERKKDE